MITIIDKAACVAWQSLQQIVFDFILISTTVVGSPFGSRSVNAVLGLELSIEIISSIQVEEIVTVGSRCSTARLHWAGRISRSALLFFFFLGLISLGWISRLLIII